MVDIDDSKQNGQTQIPITTVAPASTDEQQQYIEDISKQIEVLLHASEAPLTANVLKKHLSVSTKELKQALQLLQVRLDTGVLSLHETASGYRLQTTSNT